MDTIQRAASTAGQAIFGAHPGNHVEPVSGEMGDTRAGEPYDAGNLGDELAQQRVESNPSPGTVPGAQRQTQRQAQAQGYAGGGQAYAQKPAAPTAGQGYAQQQPTTAGQGYAQQQPTTGAGYAQKTPATPPDFQQPPAPAEAHLSTVERHSEPYTIGSSISGQGAPVAAGGAGGAQQGAAGVKHQGADAPLDRPRAPEPSPTPAAGGVGAAAVRPPSGVPGVRRSLSGGAPSGGAASGAGRPAPGPAGDRRASLTGHLPGAPGGEGLRKTSSGSGTGELWVRSSGMKAEGGDFDAAAPGAGREADRLLTEKGFKRRGSDSRVMAGETDPHPPKEGLKEKVKEKLHVGHGHHE